MLFASAKPRTTGAIFMASGRVPKIDNVLNSPSLCLIMLRVHIQRMIDRLRIPRRQSGGLMLTRIRGFWVSSSARARVFLRERRTAEDPLDRAVAVVVARHLKREQVFGGSALQIAQLGRCSAHQCQAESIRQHFPDSPSRRIEDGVERVLQVPSSCAAIPQTRARVRAE